MTDGKKIKENKWWMLVVGLLILAVPCVVSVSVYKTRCDEIVEKAQSMGMILIDKESMTLRVIDANGIVVLQSGVATGKNYGNKEKEGDMKTPEGIFHVSEIQDASDWSHDFGDGRGEIEGAYGPWFIRLETPPHTGIGIHGTHDPGSIGTRASEGCIRLKNEVVERLRRYVYVGMPVVITPGRLDVCPPDSVGEGITKAEEAE